jgi:hypothetical protein
MVKLVDSMAPLLARTVMVREQLGFALNRLNRRDEAETTLRAVSDECGPRHKDLSTFLRRTTAVASTISP